MRNRELVQRFDATVDMGLDAVDILSVEKELVAFSTELNSPHGNFYHGDLRTTSGACIPNVALLRLFQVSGDRGLDAIHFVGKLDDILGFLDAIQRISRAEWLRDPGKLVTMLKEHQVDIWFSIEGTERVAATTAIYDGDILSAANGTVVATNADLMHASVPAGIPKRGIDYGLDALSGPRSGRREELRLSTEILHRGELAFNDGDILKFANGIALRAEELYKPFEPKADFVGTDAFYLYMEEKPMTVGGFMPHVLKYFQQRVQALRRAER